MRLVVVTLGVLTVASFLAVFWLAHYAGMPAWSIWPLFQDSETITKLVDLALIAGVIAVVTLGLLTRNAVPAPGGSRAMRFTVLLAPALGFLAALQASFEIWQVVQEAHTTHLRVVAPGLSESLLPLALGLLAATLAAVFGLRKLQAPA